MPDTADDTQAAGQSDGSANSDANALVQAEGAEQGSVDFDPWEGIESLDDSDSTGGRQSDENGGNAPNDDPWADSKAARKEIEKLRREAAGYRTKYNEAKPQLDEYQKYLDSQKTEQEKLAEAKETAERELTDLRSANARLMAAATYNLPAELIDLLGTGTEDEIGARAQLLSEKLAAAAPPPAAEPERRPPAPTRPVESLTAGAKPANERPADMDALLRQWSGRT